jgi:hypothetical protein
MLTNVSEEHITSIFRVKEYAKQETSVKEDGMQTLAYSLTLKMKVICSSKTLVNFQWTI